MVSPLIYLGFHLQTLSCLARVPEVPASLLVSPMPTRTQNSCSIAHLTQTAGLTVMVKASAWPSFQQAPSWKQGSTISSFYGQKPHSVGVEPVPQNKPRGRRWKEGFIKENREISPKSKFDEHTTSSWGSHLQPRPPFKAHHHDFTCSAHQPPHLKHLLKSPDSLQL